MYKRLIALIAALIMCFCVTGCSGGDVPDGMLAASIEGEPFKLYVPKGWTVNTVSGISGAFYAGTDNIAVSARYFPADGASVEDYVTSCIYSYSIANEDFLLDGEMTATVLGGADATEIKFTSEYDGKSFTFRQLFTKHDGDIILLSFLVGVMITVSEPDLSVLASQVTSVDSYVLILAVGLGVGIFLVLAMLPEKGQHVVVGLSCQNLFQRRIHKVASSFFVSDIAAWAMWAAWGSMVQAMRHNGVRRASWCNSCFSVSACSGVLWL